MRSILAAPLAAAVMGLAASAAVTFALHRDATAALDRVLAERLHGAGESAALLLSGKSPSPEALRDLMRANRLDGAWVVDRSLKVLADATGPGGVRANLLRVDAARAERALSGEASVGPSFALGDLTVATGYFPVRDASGTVAGVLGLEAGEPFARARRDLGRSLVLGLAIAVVGAGALALVAARWAAAERARLRAALAAARADGLSRMAATAAHEIRNPLGVIRATIELMRERSAGSLGERDRGALQDVLGEVERLHRLTQDFLELSADRPLAVAEVDPGEVIDDAARRAEASHPGITVVRDVPALPVIRADAGRLLQVLANLLSNAAQAQGTGTVTVQARAGRQDVRISVRDRGPGIAPEARDRLFEPFFSTKETGTGLGLALSRRIVERHGGSLRLADPGPPGAAFEVRLPREPR
jgi:signal transduction histidine kinase